MPPPERGGTCPITAYYSIYRSRKDERLSWPSWLTCSGRFTHISGHPTTAGPAQDRENSQAKYRRSHHCATQLMASVALVLMSALQYRQHGTFVQEFQNIGSKYNRSARPFLGSQPAGGSAPHAVNMQYNSPMGLYSAENAANAYSTQSAALQTGMQRSGPYLLSNMGGSRGGHGPPKDAEVTFWSVAL